MRKSRFTEERIVGILHEYAAGAGGVSETLCMRVSPCEFDGSFVELFCV